MRMGLKAINWCQIHNLREWLFARMQEGVK